MRSSLALLTIFTVSQPAFCWGLKAHRLQTRAAVTALPPEMPAFFRAAGKQLEFLSTEPDRWRNSQSPQATEATGANHIFALELAPDPWPAHRHAFIAHLARNGSLQQFDDSLRRIGLAPYAIAEQAEILSGAFRRWRQTEAGPERAQLEQSILLYAGILAHWVTDVSMPLHCTIHVLSWKEGTPDPHGYSSSKDIHHRYENLYTEHLLASRESLTPLAAPDTKFRDWMSPLVPYIRACHADVETVYALDRKVPWAATNAAPGAEELTLRRLQAGAAMLRDVWWNAWLRSEP